MELFGLQPITWVLIICVVGIALRVYVGVTKNPGTKIDINVIILSFVTGLLVSVGLVAPVIDAIPNESDSLIILPLIAGQIIIVMKSESVYTAARNLIQKKAKTNTKPGD